MGQMDRMTNSKTAMERIEAHIKDAGEVTSISKMASDLEIAYSWAWMCVQRLEFAQRIYIHREKSGLPATMVHKSHIRAYVPTKNTDTPPDAPRPAI